MGKQRPADKNTEGIDRFERIAQHERRMSRVFYVLTALAVAGYLYALKADYDESMAVIEACKHNQTWKCMDEAQEAYRKSRQ